MDDYLAKCYQFGGGSVNQDTWRGLRSLLGERTNGWHFEILNPDFDPAAAWCFGVAGAARLVVTVELCHVVLYEADRDYDQSFQTVSGLAAWLEGNEQKYEGFTPLQEELIDHLLPLKIKEWSEEEPYTTRRNVLSMQPQLRFTLLALHLNALLDGGHALDIQHTRVHVDTGDVLDWLTGHFGGAVDLSLMGPSDRAIVIEAFQGYANTIDAQRKFGVQRNGLALLLAYCIEGIQQQLP